MARGAALALVLAALAGVAQGQRFRPDDPLWRDPDDRPVPRPGEVELSTTWDVIEHTLSHGPGSGPIPPAMNVNSLGEVPDSSWFTNRIGVRPMTLEELALGPHRTGGPDTSGPLTVISGKSGGITPGFTIRDARGTVYFVKFDPAAHPALASAADVITSKFFHAMGYHVPENHVAHLRPEQLVIGEGATVSGGGQKRRPMPRSYLDRILRHAARTPDGRIRVVASLRLPGTPLGPHKFHGTRADDPNDVFPHEHRRELRGYRIFSAWLNHDDSRSLNSLDMFVPAGGEGAERGHVKHYLIDFSSTLGSGSNAVREIAPQNPRAGNEYLFEAGPILKTAVTLGLWERPWRKVRYEVIPGVGRLEAEFFEPHAWRPEYPNPAFTRLLREDAFWAARIVSRFSDEAIRSIVRTGELANPASERYLADTIIRRRDKVVAFYLRQLNPLHGFRVEDGRLVFENLGVEAGLGRAEGYEYEWWTFDNDSGSMAALGAPGFAAAPAVPLPEDRADFLKARIRTRSAEPFWRQAVDVFLRMRGDVPEVVGLEREGGPQPIKAGR